MKPIKRVFIVTAIVEEWGGSESLWFAAVPHLLKEGIQVFVVKETISREHPKFKWLASQGVLLNDLVMRPEGKKKPERPPAILNRFENNIANYCILLETYKPDLVLINQGVNFDGLYFGLYAQKAGIPYAILAHKAVEFFWPQPQERAFMKEVWKGSLRNYFVSNHNLQFTRFQFGMEIPAAERVYYPIRRYKEPLPFPSENDTYRLACIGRLFLLDKGQDILLQILSEPTWRNRNIQVDFIGSGDDKEALNEMADFLQLPNVRFIGYSTNEHIWEDYHALLLPSRSEGLPLVVQEAMASGRIAIAGNAGGTAELVVDGRNGFLGEANVSDFRLTMERAWEKRSEWKELGLQAFQDFHAFYPEQPIEQFADSVKSLLHG
jgi:glycosyltransferase involved in cell wall biosynthesis